MEKTLYSTCIQHGMFQCLIVYAVFSTLETQFWTFDGVAHPHEELFFYFNGVTMHIHVFIYLLL